LSVAAVAAKFRAMNTVQIVSRMGPTRLSVHSK